MSARKPSKSAPHGLPGHLVGFVESLRQQGISIGSSETVDAARVMVVLGLRDRARLREGLACAVLHRPEHRETFDALFDLWFPPALGARVPEATDFDIDDVDSVRNALVELLEADGASARLDALIAQIVEVHGKYYSSRGSSFSSYQAVKALSLEQIERRLLAGLLRAGESKPTNRMIAKSVVKQRISKVRKLIDAETKRRTAEQLGREKVTAYGVPLLAENVDFLRASGEQLRSMRRVVAPLARTLASRLAARRRRARAGRIDLRRTLRKSMSTGGVPIDVVQKKPRPGRPELVVLCDVSGSVAGFSHFTLLLVHALRQQFSRVRVFAFIDTIDEVTHMFAPDADLVDVLLRITREAKVFTGDGHSDYGNSFEVFVEQFPNVLSPRGSLLILGDARTNYRDPAREVVRSMVAASRHAYWLNPESQVHWGSGDSAATHYRGVIAMHECQSAKQLAEVIDSLLTV